MMPQTFSNMVKHRWNRSGKGSLKVLEKSLTFRESVAALFKQAVCCQLRGLPPDDAQWTRLAAEWLMDAALRCVIKVLSDDPLIIDMLTTDCTASLVDQMATIRDLWER